MRILYVDAYDSFTNNIIGLLKGSLNVSVTLVRIDDLEVVKNLEGFLSSFSAVVVGPGPGDPRNAKDVGFINRLWNLQGKDILPILGICLGFQSLALAFGARVDRLPEPRHGLVTLVSHQGKDIFSGVGCFRATQYHSLRAELGHDVSSDSSEIWNCSKSCPLLQPLAWDLHDSQNGLVLQAIRHVAKPYWGFQYHPESICTSKEGTSVVQAWWVEALAWLRSHGKMDMSLSAISLPKRMSQPLDTGFVGTRKMDPDRLVADSIDKLSSEPQWEVCYKDIPSGRLTVVELCESLRLSGSETILLDSQETKGRFSILGLIIPSETIKLVYTVRDRRLAFLVDGKEFDERYLANPSKVWSILQGLLQTDSLATESCPPTPFCGGLMGYISYEAGLDNIGVHPLVEKPMNEFADLSFAFITRSIVIDHIDQHIYIQSLLHNDDAWLSRTATSLLSLSQIPGGYPSPPPEPEISGPFSPSSDPAKTIVESEILSYFRSGTIAQPSSTHYVGQIHACQQALHAGSSYELCLTAQTLITIPHSPSYSHPWALYKSLRRLNPAPFGAYLRLNGLTILSSSPERFLCWDHAGACQMRPIKGTVRKTPSMTFARASELLETSKERAENLMIVDLVRHDLSGVVGAQNCHVAKLMRVEEYETVFQLVSVVEGRLPVGDGRNARPTGVDVLREALPPGSMTGAPKKRSCELLDGIENRPRGVYSGVLGYLDVRGGGDFSVVIRTAVRRDEERIWKRGGAVVLGEGQAREEVEFGCREAVPHEVWRVGAGGAVTVQSSVEGELEEMRTKLESVLRIFQPV